MAVVNMKDLKSSPFKLEAPPYFSPVQLGCISITGPIANNRRQYHDDNRGLRILHRRGKDLCVKALKMDLNEGKEKSISRFKLDNPINPIEIEHLDFIFEWILRHEKEFTSVRPQVVCWRKKLQELLCTPYEKSNGWIYCASKVDGVIYLTSYETKAVEYARLNRNQRDELLTYWGYKFEHLMTTDPTDQKALKEPVNDYDTFHAVLNSKIGKRKISIVFGAEIDCVDPEKKDVAPPGCYVELKTTRRWTMRSTKEIQNYYEFKAIKLWSQSHIGGIPRIITGYRDDNGIVSLIKEEETSNIPNLVKRNGMSWDHEVCLSFLNDFMELLCDTVVHNHDRVLYKFQWSPGKQHVLVTEESPDSNFKFVPDWFIQKRLLSAQ